MSDSDVDHGLAKLPEISVDEASPHLQAHQLVKVEVRYPCLCGSVVRTSDVVPRTVLMDTDQFATRVRQVTGMSRDAWRGHLRGER